METCSGADADEFRNHAPAFGRDKPDCDMTPTSRTWPCKNLRARLSGCRCLRGAASKGFTRSLCNYEAWQATKFLSY
jgi:hypothetical protein